MSEVTVKDSKLEKLEGLVNELKQVVNEDELQKVIHGEKPWYKSKTIWGTIIILIAFIINCFFGDVVHQEDTNIIIKNLDIVFAVFGTFLSIYGRIKAKAKIKSH